MRFHSRRRREQRAYAVAVGTLAAIAAWACIAVAAFGQITITPEKPAPYDVIVASVNPGQQIPEGAKVRGSWDCSTLKWTPCGANVHMSAAPGKHVIRAFGVWVLTKDVTIGDQTVPVLVDFGQYSFQTEVLIGSDPGPFPPPPTGKFQIVMFYQADQLDNYPQSQRSLLTSRTLREKLVAQGHVILEILEEAAIGTSGGHLADFIKSVAGDPLPRLALRPVSGGAVTDYPLPVDEAGLMKLLGVK